MSDGLTTVVSLENRQLRLVRHPADGRIVAFADPDAAFAFAVSLEIAGAQSAGTVGAPAGKQVHLLEPGVTGPDLITTLEVAA